MFSLFDTSVNGNMRFAYIMTFHCTSILHSVETHWLSCNNQARIQGGGGPAGPGPPLLRQKKKKKRGKRKEKKKKRGKRKRDKETKMS